MRATSPISGRPGMNTSMSMAAITSTLRRHGDGRAYDRCGYRESTCLNPQNFAITIGKPIGAQILPDSLRIPHGTPQQMLHAIGRRIAVDFRQLPAVFTLHGAEQAPDRGPGAATSVTAGKVGHEPSFHLGQPEGPCTHRLQRQVGWRRALLLS